MLNRILLLFLLTISFTLAAQDEWDNIKVIEDVDVVVDSVTIGLHDSPEFSLKEIERSVQPMKKKYTGFAIELIVSDHLLATNHAIFNDFGRIFLENSSTKYHYLFPVDYRRRKSMKNFFRKIIKPKAPNAKVVQYLNGVRTTEFSW